MSNPSWSPPAVLRQEVPWNGCRFLTHWPPAQGISSMMYVLTSLLYIYTHTVYVCICRFYCRYVYICRYVITLHMYIHIYRYIHNYIIHKQSNSMYCTWIWVNLSHHIFLPPFCRKDHVLNVSRSRHAACDAGPFGPLGHCSSGWNGDCVHPFGTKSVWDNGKSNVVNDD